MEILLRHAVERGDNGLGPKIDLRQVRFHRARQCLDIDRVVVPIRRHAHIRLPAHLHERAERLIARCRRGCGCILRIKRHKQNAVAALLHQCLDTALGRGIRITHRPVDNDARVVESCGKLFRLVPGDGLERTLVLLLVPNRVVVAALCPGPLGQDDEVQDRPPDNARRLDHPAVRKEFLEIAPHRPVVSGIRCAEVEQQHANAAGAKAGRRGEGLRFGTHSARTPPAAGRPMLTYVKPCASISAGL